MSILSLRLPDSIHKAAKLLAQKEHTSINQFITLAIAEKLAALEAETYLVARAKQGNRKKFLKALSSAPDVEPDQEDQL